ncbi:hypothetical protein [Actinocorallia sp. A-T 12471]|uniref:hypothetical protein n=1 Tax=Actinocorallia sp. A-T 12471 TaxID=3089813 RepID=UPI0029D256B0|nr:hypothetical protein [Actinocorallia sp. A-T 12471]MDX6739979.1 hypothetical protein [Actinocorallia sp. A-T 12471]
MRGIRLAGSLAALAGGLEVLIYCIGFVVVPMEEVTRQPIPGYGLDLGSAVLAYLLLITWGTLNAAVLVLAAARGLLVHRDLERWRHAQRRVLQACAGGFVICVLAAIAAYTDSTAIPGDAVRPSLIHFLVYCAVALVVVLCLLPNGGVRDLAAPRGGRP